MAEGGTVMDVAGAGGGAAAGGRGDADDLPVTLVKYNNPVLVIKHAEKTPEQKVGNNKHPLYTYRPYNANPIYIYI